MQPKCYSVIIAGGKGTRFWPLSRSQRPKQLLRILSPKTLIDETADRVRALGGRAQTLVVTVSEQVSCVAQRVARFAAKQFYRRTAGQKYRSMHRLGRIGSRRAGPGLA